MPRMTPHARALASFLKCTGAVTFRFLSRIAAIGLVLLTLCPCTAPFSTYDLTAEASSAQDASDSTAKAMSALPVLVSLVVVIAPADSCWLPDASPASLQAGRSPFSTVL